MQESLPLMMFEEVFAHGDPELIIGLKWETEDASGTFLLRDPYRSSKSQDELHTLYLSHLDDDGKLTI